MSATGRSPVRHADDFYATPAWVTELILPQLSWTGVTTALDPAAGEGAILNVVRDYAQRNGLQVKTLGIELDEGRFQTCTVTNDHRGIRGDALAHTTWYDIRPGLVVMNPPFKLAQEFCETALAHVAPGGEVAALMRLSMLESAKRETFWRRYAHADVYVLGKRPSFTGGSTDSCAYAWFVWREGRQGSQGRWFRLG